MNEQSSWGEASRHDLRESIELYITGQVRLAKYDSEGILEGCREIYIDDECPEDEREEFVEFASDFMTRVVDEYITEQANWPLETDCDRLDRVEATLREQGILLWQVSPCCDTCSDAELPDRIDLLESRYPGFRDNCRGYSFFIDQSLPEMLAESTEVSLYLAFGWFSPDGSDIAPEVYKENALSIAREVIDALRNEGFEVDWNGDFSRKFCLTMNWQRRSLLE